jgi:hypothetical protein
MWICGGRKEWEVNHKKQESEKEYGRFCSFHPLQPPFKVGPRFCMSMTVKFLTSERHSFK